MDPRPRKRRRSEGSSASSEPEFDYGAANNGQLSPHGRSERNDPSAATPSTSNHGQLGFECDPMSFDDSSAPLLSVHRQSGCVESRDPENPPKGQSAVVGQEESEDQHKQMPLGQDAKLLAKELAPETGAQEIHPPVEGVELPLAKDFQGSRQRINVLSETEKGKNFFRTDLPLIENKHYRCQAIRSRTKFAMGFASQDNSFDEFLQSELAASLMPATTLAVFKTDVVFRRICIDGRDLLKKGRPQSKVASWYRANFYVDLRPLPRPARIFDRIWLPVRKGPSGPKESLAEVDIKAPTKFGNNLKEKAEGLPEDKTKNLCILNVELHKLQASVRRNAMLQQVFSENATPEILNLIQSYKQNHGLVSGIAEHHRTELVRKFRTMIDKKSSGFGDAVTEGWVDVCGTQTLFGSIHQCIACGTKLEVSFGDHLTFTEFQHLTGQASPSPVERNCAKCCAETRHTIMYTIHRGGFGVRLNTANSIMIDAQSFVKAVRSFPEKVLIDEHWYWRFLAVGWESYLTHRDGHAILFEIFGDEVGVIDDNEPELWAKPLEDQGHVLGLQLTEVFYSRFSYEKTPAVPNWNYDKNLHFASLSEK